MRKNAIKIIFKFSNWLIAALLFSSCGNGEGDKPVFVSNDSTPAPIRKINDKINADRNNPDLYFERAKVNFQYKNTEEAFSDMNIALKIDSTKPAYYVFLSDLYFTQNKTRDTRDMLWKAISADSANSEALMKYSQLFYLLRKYDTAAFYINRSLHYNNTSALSHFQKGMILKEWGDSANAVESFQDAVKYDQQYYDAYMQLGMLLSIKKNSLALSYFNNALNIRPKSIETLYAIGKFYQNSKEYEQALTTYNSLLSFDPQNQDVTFNIGAILFEQKKYDEAIKQFQMTIDRDANFYRGYYGRGRCYEEKGEKQKAIGDYKRCLELQPDYTLAAEQLDFIERRVKRKTE